MGEGLELPPTIAHSLSSYASSCSSLCFMWEASLNVVAVGASVGPETASLPSAFVSEAAGGGSSTLHFQFRKILLCKVIHRLSSISFNCGVILFDS